jgi:GNAT superfamily N-acetyltransferase
MRSRQTKLKQIARHSKIFIELFLRGHCKFAAKELGRHLWKKHTVYGVMRDVSVPWRLNKNPPFRLNLRRIENEDVSELFRVSSRLNAEGVAERLKRYFLYTADIDTCYVAVDENNRLYHVHWLIDASQNNKLLDYFSGGFPVLKDDEMLLEGGFTPEAYRGKSLMSWTMATLAEKAREMGFAKAIGFIRADNIPSLKASIAAGYKPYCIRIDIWRLLQRKIVFRTLSTSELQDAPFAR